MVADNNSITINVESWFIPFDIIMIVSILLAIVLGLILLGIVVFDKTSRTMSMMLVCNSCLSELVLECTLLSMSVFSLQNDKKQIQYQDSLCIFRAYILYVSYSLQNYSYLLQAIYRYITIIYPTRILWQSARFQITLIAIQWFVSFIYPFPFFFTGQTIYLPDNQICQMPLKLSIYVIYNSFFVYIIPISCIILIYVKLVLYVRRMGKRVTPVNTLVRAQRDLKMVFYIVILVTFIVIIGLPYMSFILMSFITNPPKYHLRIAFLCANVSLMFVMTALFVTTESLRTTILKTIGVISNVITPATA